MNKIVRVGIGILLLISTLGDALGRERSGNVGGEVVTLVKDGRPASVIVTSGRPTGKR